MNRRALHLCAALYATALVSACVRSTEEEENAAVMASGGDRGTARGAAGGAPRVPVEALFDSNVVYLGLSARPPKVEPGQKLVITQYWRLLAPLSESDRTQRGAWQTMLEVEGPYGRGSLSAERTSSKAAPPLGQWPVGVVIEEQFEVIVPTDWAQPALWVFASIGAEQAGADGDSAAYGSRQALRVVRGPDDEATRIRALTIRVRRAGGGQAPAWIHQVGVAPLGELLE